MNNDFTEIWSRWEPDIPNWATNYYIASACYSYDGFKVILEQEGGDQIERDGKVLITQRAKNDSLLGKWEFSDFIKTSNLMCVCLKYRHFRVRLSLMNIP